MKTRAAPEIDPFALRRSTLPLERAAVSKSPRTGGPRFVISTGEVDLMGDIVVQQGLAPISARIPAQVDHSGKMRDLIGWWDNIELDKSNDRTTADLVLFDKGLSPVADMVRALDEAGVQMASSIGFMPEWSGDGYEVLFDEEENFTGIKFNRSRLIETSVVVVPANPGALQLRSAQVAKRMGVDEARVRNFLVSDTSRLLLQGMGQRDLIARAAAATKRATQVLAR
jgi:hypothetical protein